MWQGKKKRSVWHFENHQQFPKRGANAHLIKIKIKILAFPTLELTDVIRQSGEVFTFKGPSISEHGGWCRRGPGGALAGPLTDRGGRSRPVFRPIGLHVIFLK